jgi:hypothetical protein
MIIFHFIISEQELILAVLLIFGFNTITTYNNIACLLSYLLIEVVLLLLTLFTIHNLLLVIISTNHIYVGIIYIISGLIGGAIGFTLSLILRLELALPGFIICSSLQYNSCITFHGIFTIFFTIMPILIGGFGNILIPLMLCSQDMIFPRLNALSL